MKERRFSPVAAGARLSFCGKTRLEIVGLNQLRLISELQKAGIRLFDVQKLTQNRLLLSVKTKDSAKTFAICERMCYTYNVALYSGAGAIMRACVSRAGLFLGTAALVTLSVLSQGFFTGVTVEGNSSVPDFVIKEAASEAGGGVGKRISAVSRDEIRSSVNAVEGIAESSVRVDGTRLIVSVTEATAHAQPTEKRTEIRAVCDGIVTRVVCRRGTPTVKSGDLVRKGDLLITSARYDQNGEEMPGDYADGEVYGTLVRHEKRLAFATATEKSYTGRTEIRTALCLFGAKIGKTSGPFERSESETKTATLSGLLPITVEQITYREYTLTTVTRTVEELTALCVAEAKNGYFYGEDCSVRTNAVMITDGAYEISVYLEREGILSH